MKKLLSVLLFVLSLALVSRAEPTKSPTGVKRAVLVGVGMYADLSLSRLKTPTNDVKDLAKQLEKIGFDPKNITTLTSAEEDPASRPTARNIRKKINEAVAACGRDDILFILLTGHGINGGRFSYFCAEDSELESIQTTGINIEKTVEELEDCEAVFKWVVVDACRNSKKGTSEGVHLNNPPEGVALFQSCQFGEVSQEDEKHGLFMEHFLSAFQPENSDINQDGLLSFGEICSYATRKTQEASYNRQNPTLDRRGIYNDFVVSSDLNRVKAEKSFVEAKKLRLAGKLTEAKAQIDLALAHYSSDEKYLEEKRAIQKEQEIQDLKEQIEELKARPAEKPTSASKITKKKKKPQTETVKPAPKLTPTSRESFEWDGTKITKFIGKETSVVIPEGVTEIGEGAFLDCSSLTSVVIPDSVQKIGDGAFAGCIALKQWSISSDHPYFKTDGTGLQTKDGKILVACLASATEYRIPEGVTEIGDGAFYGCSSLTSVVIPEGVTEIGEYAFFGCSSLTSVVIPEGVKGIGALAFFACRSLTSVVIPEGVTEIGGMAFAGCSSLTSVVIPEGVTNIGMGAFYECPKLTIRGKKGSEAEKSAKENKIPFKVQ